MELPASLVAALTSLTEALDDRGVDLRASVERFGEAASFAVDSYAGLSVHVSVHGRDLGFTQLDEDTLPTIATSLRLDLGRAHSPAPELDGFPSVVLILYAATPGAFIDMSADLDWLLGSRAHTIALDDDLVPQDLPPFEMSLAEMSTINQAIGVLIGRGNTPDQARHELTRLTATRDQTITAAAERLLNGLSDQRQPPDDSAEAS